MPGLGESFRAAREARNLSLSDVAEQIHIRAIYLQAIEEEEWSAIAAPVYVRGFIRTYARFLGLDPQGSIDRFNAVAGEPSAVPPPISVSPVRRGPSAWLWVGGIAAAVLVGLVAFNYLQLQRGASGEATALASPVPLSAASPAPAASAAPLAAGGAIGTASAGASPDTGGHLKNAALVVRLREASWLRIDIDGRNKDEGVFDKGTVLEFNGKAAKVRAGNAGGVDVTLNGKDQGVLGKSGTVVERSYDLGTAPGG
jgi:cytoskeletal protein RodZ